MGWSCIIPGKEIDEMKADRKKAKGFERYDISDKAVYFQGQYLPVSEIKSIRLQPSVYRVEA